MFKDAPHSYDVVPAGLKRMIFHGPEIHIQSQSPCIPNGRRRYIQARDVPAIIPYIEQEHPIPTTNI